MISFHDKKFQSSSLQSSQAAQLEIVWQIQTIVNFSEEQSHPALCRLRLKLVRMLFLGSLMKDRFITRLCYSRFITEAKFNYIRIHCKSKSFIAILQGMAVGQG